MVQRDINIGMNMHAMMKQDSQKSTRRRQRFVGYHDNNKKKRPGQFQWMLDLALVKGPVQEELCSNDKTRNVK
jgi:hypothetical protein